MKLLALDTATENCSCALWLDGEKYGHVEFAPRRHANLILGMIDDILARSETARGSLDAVVFGRGPGSFTGLRIACGVAQGIALGLDIPVIPVSTLAALAQGAHRLHHASHVLAGIDARMQEVYWGVYTLDDKGIMVLSPGFAECVSAAEHAPLPVENTWLGYGSAWEQYADSLRARLGGRLNGHHGTVYPQAEDMLPAARRAFTRGELLDAGKALPLYLRDRVAEKAVKI